MIYFIKLWDQRLITTETKTLKKGITRTGYAQNENMKQQCNFQPIWKWAQVRRRQLKHRSRVLLVMFARKIRDGNTSPGISLSKEKFQGKTILILGYLFWKVRNHLTKIDNKDRKLWNHFTILCDQESFSPLVFFGEREFKIYFKMSV